MFFKRSEWLVLLRMKVRNILLNMIVLYFTNFQKSILHLKFIRVRSQFKSYREQLAVNKSVHHVQEQR